MFFLGISCIVIICVSVVSGDTLIGLVSSTTGVIYTICNGKGKKIAFIFGLINAVLYSYIAYTARNYSDFILYAVYYIPAMIIGFFSGKKQIDSKSLEVLRRKMNVKQCIVLFLICFVSVIAISYILFKFTDDSYPFYDSFTACVSVIATVLAIKRFREQWVLGTSVNFVESVVGFFRYINGVENAISTLIMWLMYLIIGLVMGGQGNKKISMTKNHINKN